MEYLFKSTALISVFMCFYWLFLQKETHFTSNRFYFVVSIIASLILPFIVYPIYINAPMIEQLPMKFIETPTEKISIITNETPSAKLFMIDWFLMIKGIYLVGIITLLIKFMIDIVSLYRLLRQSDKLKEEHITFVQTLKNISPFSVFNYIVYNKKMFTSEELEQIILHEKIHVNQKHSYDLLLINIVLIVQWFNPFVWLFKKQLEQNLEFIVDSQVAKQTNKLKEYQYLLLKTSIKSNPFTWSTNFYNSFIKKRIIMLQKTPTKKKNYLKLLLLLPILTVFLFAFNKKEIIKEGKTKNQTIVIDVSHGGKDTGATEDGITEKEIVQAIATKIKATYKGTAKLVFTRENDQFVSLSDRIKQINKINPDMVISLHINSSKNTNKNGVLAYINTTNNLVFTSKKNAEKLLNVLKGTELNSLGLTPAKFKLIREVKSPSVLLELGFLSNEKDRTYLVSAEGQNEIANSIINYINGDYKVRLNSKKTEFKKVKKASDVKEKFNIKIDKSTTEEELNQIVSLLKEKGVIIKFKSVKRNKQNEIKAIKISAKYKGQETSYSVKRNTAIDDIVIQITETQLQIAPKKIEKLLTEDFNLKNYKRDDAKNNKSTSENKNVEVKTVVTKVEWNSDDNDEHEDHDVTFIKKGDKDGKKIIKKRIVKKYDYKSDHSDKDGEHKVIMIKSDGGKEKITINGKEVSIEDIKNGKHGDIHMEVIEDLDLDKDGKQKTIKIISKQIDTDVEMDINVDDILENVESDNFVFISGDDQNAKIIVNGKEVTNEELKKMSKEDIKTIEIHSEKHDIKKDENGNIIKSENIFIKKIDGSNENVKFIVNGKEMSKEELKKMKPEDIKTLEIKKEKK